MKQKSIKIVVTARNIQTGVRDNMKMCPISKAARKAGLRNVSTDGNMIECRRNTAVDSTIYALPQKAKQFVRRFDEGQRVRPITFTATELEY